MFICIFTSTAAPAPKERIVEKIVEVERFVNVEVRKCVLCVCVRDNMRIYIHLFSHVKKVYGVCACIRHMCKYFYICINVKMRLYMHV